MYGRCDFVRLSRVRRREFSAKCHGAVSAVGRYGAILRNRGVLNITRREWPGRRDRRSQPPRIRSTRRCEAEKFISTGTSANLNKEWPVNYWLLGYRLSSPYLASPLATPRLASNPATRCRSVAGVPQPRVPARPDSLITSPSCFILSPVPGALINTVREFSYELSARRVCKRRESD